MHLDKETLIKQLPPYQDKWETVMYKQEVKNIIQEILKAHQEFRAYYDRIAANFYTGNLETTFDKLYAFCKDNIRYLEESEEWQTTALPTGILIRGYGDCKHFSSFIGGCLDAISRQFQPVEWCYYFASYKVEQRTPYHVFIAAKDDNGEEIWIDPTPGAHEKTPVWEIRKKI